TAARRGEKGVDTAAIPAGSPEVETDNRIFVPPFLGSRVVKGIAVDEVAAYLNETALFRNQWQYRPEKGENDDEFKTRVRAVLREEVVKAKASGVLVPQVVYGYIAANGEGNDVVVWKDETRTAERMRFPFPRQSEPPYLC